ncbi:MAG: glycosyl transferase family 36 [Desulfobacterota bacterium]|nr:glycosyl transferase family 36 [Thermodesulfobacteriota bacterium]
MNSRSGLLWKSNIMLGNVISHLLGCCSIAATGYEVYQGNVSVAAVLGILTSVIITYGATGSHVRMRHALLDGLVAAVFAASADPEAQVLQAPLVWLDLCSLTTPTAALAAVAYFGLSAATALTTGRHIKLTGSISLLLVPYLCNVLLILLSQGLRADIGRFLIGGAFAPSLLVQWLGSVAVLVFINEATATLLFLVLAGRLLTDQRMHGLLLATALLCASAPLTADFGCHQSLLNMHPFVAYFCALLAALLSQASLWAETFLITGILIDALRGRPPLWYWGRMHGAEGIIKGSIFTGVFFCLIYGIASAAARENIRFFIGSVPVLFGALSGIILFPLVKTLVESFDGSLPFFVRLHNNYGRIDHWMRGAVVGAGIAWALRSGLATADPELRFLIGAAFGALAYGGVNFLRDAVGVLVLNRRIRLQAIRIYLCEAVLGGFAGGAVGWYFDALQLGVIAEKFKQYATIRYDAAGIPVKDYVIYPLCNKWGAMNLGTVQGGVRLFFCEALSGVVMWAIAAPLFSINLVLLSAVVHRSTTPLKMLTTRQGLVSVVEQAFRVQRWGLWMAPIIYSFLRLSPIPTWYNQDGAVRTVIAALKCIMSSPEEFHAWSLAIFTNMLAYDWLRIAIYIDHMLLRVATLVNFSFVGMDVLDEKLARLYGHSIRTRVIPQGLRRFVTWAPLLIPFYLPRGADWSHAWNTAERIARQQSTTVLSPALLIGLFAVIAVGTGMALLIRTIRQPPSSPLRTAALDIFEIGNGLYTLCISRDGRGFSRVYSFVRRGTEFDLTRRPHDELQQRGKFVYLQNTEDPELIWSLFREPTGIAGHDYTVCKIDRLTLTIRNTWNNIAARALVRIHPHLPLEIWTITLRNTSAHTRHIRLVSYQEFALNTSDMYLRHPEYNGLHIGTWFIPSLNALVASNRLLKQPARHLEHQHLSGEVAFHAVGEPRGNTVLLTGYEDDRKYFIGKETLRMPAALMKKPRGIADDGLLYTGDPAASLHLHVTLRPNAETTIVFADGYAASLEEAAMVLREHLRLPLLCTVPLDASLKKKRTLHGFEGQPEGMPSPLPFSFSADGTELRVGIDTPRPWSHVIANEQGYGMVINNHGEIYSFMGNSQQNGLTPFFLNDEPIAFPGQALYLCNTRTGEIDTPTFAPCRTAPDCCSVTYGRGYAVFEKKTLTAHLSLSVCVLPDAPAELRLLTVRNTSSTEQTFRVVPYLQIVLGETPLDTRGQIISQYDEHHQMLMFANPTNQFCRGWAFVAMSLPLESYTTSRSRFLGADNHNFSCPHMVRHGIPDMTIPAGDPPAAALVGTITVPAGGEHTVVVIVGQAQTSEEAVQLAEQYRIPANARAAFRAAQAWWAELLSVLRITTNKPEFDRLVNDWLPYQVYTAHLWGRVGPNQRSGGYGYRDQLQAVLPLLPTNPALARRQILLHAAQQFYASGDVLQWWHQSWEGKSGLGARNRASDPHLWLPYLVYHYVRTTGDSSILDEDIPFLERRRIPRDREGVVFAPRPSLDRAPLYVHCIKAIDTTLGRLGPHGLPLIGTGDWNDGLNSIGIRGRGESVWLGFFLFDIITGFAPLIRHREGAEREKAYRAHAQRLRHALDSMWRDGRYVRAITDDGREMVFADALTAAWPAISGAADPDRSAQALLHGLQDLEKENMVLLLTPPFTEHADPYPGKIADYPPGIRENGGQYSHGVSWFVDGLVRLAEMAEQCGDFRQADAYRCKAFEVWWKISPLCHTTAHALPRYGLPPHQQAADIYYGYGYEGKGGWSWYTGAAARMLYAAYQLLGIHIHNGVINVGNDLFRPKGELAVHSLIYNGVRYTPDNKQGAAIMLPESTSEMAEHARDTI